MLQQFRKDPQQLAAFERSVSGAQVVGPEMVGTQRATAYRYYQAAKVAGGLASSAGWVKLWVGANGLPLKVESESTGRMSQPAIGYLDPVFVEMMEELKALLRYVYQTDNALTFPVSGPGSVGMSPRSATVWRMPWAL